MQVPGTRSGERLLAAAAVAVGAWLRLHQLSEQIVIDDEWHGLLAALDHGYAAIATHFGGADYCIPLALLDRLLLDSVGLSEWALRIPVVVAGLASLLLLPWLLRPMLGPRATVAFAWLLAVSPLHVYYSRFARPYAIALLLAFGGALAAWRWWTGGGRGWLVAYVAGAVLAPWFHLTSLPVAGLPLLVFGVAVLARRRGPEMGRPLGLAGLAILLGLALLLGPPLAADAGTLAAKVEGQGELAAMVPSTWRHAAELWAGTSSPWVLLAIAGAAGAGALRLVRRQPAFAAFLLALVVIQLAALAIAQPVMLRFHGPLTRYALVVLVVLLVCVASAVAALEESLQRRWARQIPGALAPFAAAALYWAGPLRFIDAQPNNWTNHPANQSWYQCSERTLYPRATAEADPSGFYARLGLFAPPGSLRIVEAPWSPVSTLDFGLPLTQRLHRQWVAIGFVGEGPERRFGELPAGDSRLRFRNFVHVGDEAGLRERGIRLVVFHRRDVFAGAGVDAGLPDVESWIERYRARYGRPLVEDADLVVFDLGA